MNVIFLPVLYPSERLLEGTSQSWKFNIINHLLESLRLSPMSLGLTPDRCHDLACGVAVEHTLLPHPNGICRASLVDVACANHFHSFTLSLLIFSKRFQYRSGRLLIVVVVVVVVSMFLSSSTVLSLTCCFTLVVVVVVVVVAARVLFEEEFPRSSSDRKTFRIEMSLFVKHEFKST